MEDHRRKWNREEYEDRARKRMKKEMDDENGDESPEPRESLKARHYKLDLESNVGKTTVVSSIGASKTQSGGYYCDICDCTIKDNMNFLDHVNSVKHQRNMGMSMEVERSTVDQVKKRFEVLKKKKDEKKSEYSLEERLKEVGEQEESEKLRRKEKRKKNKRKEEEKADLDVDPEMAALMGFKGFASSKK